METERAVTSSDVNRQTPVYVVWEITLACNLACAHCGSRAGSRRADELSTNEALDLIASLARLGTREITLIGGEAFVRRDWLELVAAIAASGMDCTLQTGGYRLPGELITRAASLGLSGMGVSVDGPPEFHDRIRGRKGSFDEAIRVIREANAAGLTVSANTQITSKAETFLPSVMDRLIEAGVRYWQLQLTVAMGNAADNDELLIQPYQLLTLMPLLNSLYHEGQKRGITLVPGNNLGYFGPFEHDWRDPQRGYYSGCPAGVNAMGIEADGVVKACPSLPTSRYSAGNVRTTPIAEIWNGTGAIAFNRDERRDQLWGFCGSCYYADTCRGGCTWTADALFGRRGNNPYCYYRALKLQELGLRERVVKKVDADPTPFATGVFELVVEPLIGP